MASNNLQGKVVLITGGTKGIGLAIAQRVSAAGANVVLNYGRDSSAAEKALASLPQQGGSSERALVVQADASSPSQMRDLVDKAVAKFGRIDTVVANAGILPMYPFENLTEAAYDATFGLNVKGPLFLTQAAAPHIPSGGRVIFISTGLAKASALLPPYALYVSTKGAIEQLTRALAKDLGRKGITGIASGSPFNRLGSPAEIAEVVAFVASPESSWVSGQIIGANGATFV
ncbi:hypothetical protein CHU98_g2830 [Xylaria longipes]|nr:hypothetical protein CHU98_g2830 [Xylaria longipes]